jgi:hypothetical protein
MSHPKRNRHIVDEFVGHPTKQIAHAGANDHTRERLDLQLLELMPPLTTLCPPATLIDKTRYSAFAEPG